MRQLRLLVLAALLALPLAGRASERLEAQLAEADELTDAGEFERARSRLEAALDDDLADEDLKEIYERLGIVELYLGHEAAAERAFRRLLLSDPEYQLPKGTAKKIRALFTRLQQGFQPVNFRWELPAEHVAGTPLTVTLDAENLPKEPGAVLRLYFKRPTDPSWRWNPLEWDGESESRHLATLAGAPVAKPGALDLYVELVDARSRRMAGEGSALSPRRLRLSGEEVVAGALEPDAPRSGEETAWYGSPVVWGVAGAAVIGGAVLAWFVLSEEPTGELPVRVVVR